MFIFSSNLCEKNKIFNRWKVRIGDQIHAVRKGNKIRPITTANTRFLDIQRVSIHPNYDGVAAYFDIALIETATVDFTKFISPICLPGLE
jgi:hypothetical protein